MTWLPKYADATHIEVLAAELRANPGLGLDNPDLANTLACLLVMRGIHDPETAEQFLTPSLAHLHSPYAMSGMKGAVERIDAAIERKEGVLIYGFFNDAATT